MEKKENKIFNWLKKLPEKKQYFEFVKEFLYVPFLVLLILVNVYALRGRNASPSPSPSPSLSPVIQPSTAPSQLPAISTAPSVNPSVSPSPKNECKSQPQPVEIAYPSQNQKIANIEPVCVVFSKLGDNYCEQTFEYKVNDNDWTPTGEKTICLYSLPDGEITFQLRVTDENSNQAQTYTRKFSYQKTTPSPSPSPSASLNPTVSPSPSPIQF